MYIPKIKEGTRQTHLHSACVVLFDCYPLEKFENSTLEKNKPEEFDNVAFSFRGERNGALR